MNKSLDTTTQPSAATPSLVTMSKILGILVIFALFIKYIDSGHAEPPPTRLVKFDSSTQRAVVSPALTTNITPAVYIKTHSPLPLMIATATTSPAQAIQVQPTIATTNQSHPESTTFSIKQTADKVRPAQQIKISTTTVQQHAADTTAHHVKNTTEKSQPIKRTVMIKKGNTITGIFIQEKINTQDLPAILALPKVQNYLTLIRPGKKLYYIKNQHNQLQWLSYPINDAKRFEITRTPNGFTTQVIESQTSVRGKRQSLTLTSHGGTLFTLARKHGIPSKLILRFADIFSSNIDFNKGLRPGDNFRLLYEAKYVNGKLVGYGNILAAESRVAGKTFKAIRYTDDHHHTAYYDQNGESLQKAFMRFPVHFTRVSSAFDMHRKHPILKNVTRPHEGVDLAAPRNTPVHAPASGIIQYAGKLGGYGNLIILNNGNGITTRYAHLNKFAHNIHKGVRVKQNQVIAYVGMTGLATGNHLHYEYRIDNHPQDPLTVKLPHAYSIPKHARYDFTAKAAYYIAQLDKPWPTQYAAKASSTTSQTHKS